MLKNISLALLAGASFLAGIDQAAAIEDLPPSQPAEIHAEQPEPRQVAPVRMASAERSNMGGGFIEFLFGDGPSRGGRYQQQPGYQRSHPTNPGARCCRRWARSSRCAGRKMSASRRVPPSIRNSRSRRSSITARKAPARSSSTRPTSSCSWFRATARRCATASASAVPVHLVGRQADFREEGMAGLDAAAGNAGAPPGSAAAHGRRAAKSARRPRDVSGIVALPHPRLERAVDHRHQRLVRLLRMRNEDVIDLYGRVNVGARVVVI